MKNLNIIARGAMLSCLLSALPLQAQMEYLKSYNVQRALEVINEDFREAYKYVDKETDDTDDNPYAWMLLGKCYHTVGVCGEALTYTNRALEILTDKKHKRITEDPQWLAASYLQRAEVYDRLDRQELRKADLEAAMKLGKFDARTEALLVEPLDVVMAMAQYHYDQHEYGQADATYQKAIALDPHDARPLIGLGRDAMMRGEWSEAAAHFSQAHVVDSEYDPYHFYMISPYMNMGELDKAADEMWEALQVPATQGEVLESIMADTLLLKLGEPLLAKLKTKEPLDVEMEFVRVTLLMRCCRYEEALAGLKTLTEVETLEETMYGGMSNALNALGRYDEALEYAFKNVEKDSTAAEACGSVGKVLLDMTRYDEAMVWADRAIDLGPEDEGLYMLKSRIYERKGEMEKAIAPIRTALLIEPESLPAHAMLCRALKLAGHDEEMRQEAEWVLERDTVASHESAREMVLMALGRYDEALEWIDKEQEAYPFDPADDALDKAEVMILKGNLEDARKWMEEAKAKGYNRFLTLKSHPTFCEHLELFDNL